MTGERVSVFCELVCELGEGPTYDPASQTMFWFDIVGRKLMERRWRDTATRVHELPEMASALAVVDENRHLLLGETGLYLRDRSSGSLSLVQHIEADNAVTRSNDARVHPCGSFWIGTMGKNAETQAGAIYWFARGELRLLFPEITIPNSICFSPDGATAWFADTGRNVLYRVPCDPASGLPTGGREVFLDHSGLKGGIDGSVVDAQGNIWNARWGSGALDCYSPQGAHLRRIAMPARQTTCPAFAGPEADRIVVTSAWKGLEGSARDEDTGAGKTFLVELAVSGRHDARVAL